MKYKLLSLAILATTALSAEYIMKQNVGTGVVFNVEAAQPGTYNSCQAAYNAGFTSDGTYSIDIDGDGGAVPVQTVCDMTNFNGGWTQCFEFINTSSEDLTGNTWFDRCVTVSIDDDFGNSIMVKLTDSNDSVSYNAWGSFTKNWTTNHLTSDEAENSQYYFPYHDQKISLNNGHYLGISGKTAGNSGCGGDHGNGYGIMIKSVSSHYTESLLSVFPYRKTNSSYSGYGAARGFSGWTQSDEISYNNGSAWNSCSSTPGYEGKFEVFIK